MSYFTWVDKRIKKLRWFDISLIKISTAAFILLVAKLWAPLLSLDWYWYLVIVLVAGARPLFQVCKK